MLKRAAVSLVCMFSFSLGWTQQAPATNDACQKLASLTLSATKVVSAQIVLAGAFTPPDARQLNPADKALFAGLPAFCRVSLMDTPTPDSEIPIEVWLPEEGWNGKFRGQGNGGFAGQTDYAGLAVAVSQGYASGATDTGHRDMGTDPKWALGHPEKVIDYGYRAVHRTAVLAKTIAKAYYGSAVHSSYFVSCSDGGREALMEAQRFPDDYDGIVAGAPANNWTGLLTNALYNAQALLNDPASYISAAKIPAIDAAVKAACDSADGVKDGVLNDPRECHFNPSSMTCKGAENDSCLTAKQAHALEILYGGLHDSAGKLIFPGYLPGSEDGPGGWIPWITGAGPQRSLMYGFAVGYFTNMVYDRPNWEFKDAVIADAYKAALARTASALDANDPNLKPFAAHGGKLILYHGWNDPAIAALSTVGYYNHVRDTLGAKETGEFVRLFMVPGMQHCFGGPGATFFDQLGLPPAGLPNDAEHDIYLALEAWVENGKAPERLIGTKFDEKATPPRAIMTRPVCAYPLMAKYKGSGDTNEAANFTCVKED
jgi:feruloyl esterase